MNQLLKQKHKSEFRVYYRNQKYIQAYIWKYWKWKQNTIYFPSQRDKWMPQTIYLKLYNIYQSLLFHSYNWPVQSTKQQEWEYREWEN